MISVTISRFEGPGSQATGDLIIKQCLNRIPALEHPGVITIDNGLLLICAVVQKRCAIVLYVAENEIGVAQNAYRHAGAVESACFVWPRGFIERQEA